jgi:molybdopterin-guanine dinucleotide biosynthesis protein A
MGRDKATLPFGGETLLVRTVRVVAACVDDVVVVARRDQTLPPLPDAVRVVFDDVERRAVDLELLALTNCNTPEAYAEALARLARDGA